MAAAMVDNPSSMSFDPVKLREKYLSERDKRLHYSKGINQYALTEGNLSHYLHDPWTKPGFSRAPVNEEVEVVIIGGGYGAQLVCVRLLEAGISNIKILEKAGDFGGTWYWNRYPGAQCDIESYIYMPLLEELGFMPKEKYTRSKELLRHSQEIGRKWGLYEKALFQTEVKALRWNEETALWSVETNWGDNLRARFVIPAAGPLHRPKLPGVPGIGSFKGHSFHSSRWDYNYTGGDSDGNLTKLAGKRVGIIGTGATAVQIVPHLGQWAKEVYVFQRTPSSVDIRGNKPTDAAWAASLQKGWQRKRMDNFDTIVNAGQADHDDVSDAWTDIFRTLFIGDPSCQDPVQMAMKMQFADFQKMEQIRSRVDSIVKDPETAESLKPYYNQFCKRPCFHDEYLQTFNRENVTLVDTKGEGVQAITEKGVRAVGQEFELDCLIYASGFELATDWSHRTGMEIYGRDGLSISEKWKDGARTMHGWTTNSFPNILFMSIQQTAISPNFIHLTSIQAEHLTYIIRTCLDRNIRSIEASSAAEKEWTETIVQSGRIRDVYTKDCTPGYYNNEGEESIVARRNGQFGGGSPVFYGILEDWREEGRLGGLDLRGR